MHKSGPVKRKSLFAVTIALISAITMIVIIYFVIDALDYYATPFTERPHHDAYKRLKPGGSLSHGFGIFGSALLVMLLLYSVRKRTALFGNFGFMSRWLTVHIYMGLTGPALIVLHSTFKLNGLVAVSFWSMITVLLSGILGRYLYAQIPKNKAGIEKKGSEIVADIYKTTEQIKEQYSITLKEQMQLKERAGDVNYGTQNLFGLLVSILSFDLTRWVRKIVIKRKIRNQYPLPKKAVNRISNLLIQWLLLERRKLLLNKLHRMFYYWHVFHKPFAIIMYLIMLVHIGISIWLGYTWIF